MTCAVQSPRRGPPQAILEPNRPLRRCCSSWMRLSRPNLTWPDWCHSGSPSGRPVASSLRWLQSTISVRFRSQARQRRTHAASTSPIVAAGRGVVSGSRSNPPTRLRLWWFRRRTRGVRWSEPWPDCRRLRDQPPSDAGRCSRLWARPAASPVWPRGRVGVVEVQVETLARVLLHAVGGDPDGP